MCVHVPFGYSLQTMCKTIGGFEIVLASICLTVSGGLATTILIWPNYLLSLFGYEIEIEDNENDNATSSLNDTLDAQPNDDLLRFLNSRGSFQISVVLMMVIYFMCALSLAMLLRSAAQERHLQKLTVWMILQSVVNIIRLVLYILWLCWIADNGKSIDIVLGCILINFYSLTVLSIANSFRQEILMPYKRNRNRNDERSFKDRLMNIC